MGIRIIRQNRDFPSEELSRERLPILDIEIVDPTAKNEEFTYTIEWYYFGNTSYRFGWKDPRNYSFHEARYWDDEGNNTLITADDITHVLDENNSSLKELVTTAIASNKL